MKARLKLTNPLWKTPERRRILDTAVQESAAELESEIKQRILNSTPRGRIYRRGAVTKAATKPLRALGLHSVRGNQKRVVAGARFHRASAKGQPPAVDSGSLLSSIRARRGKSEMSAIVATGKNYAPILDNLNKLDRPFFKSVAEKFKPKFKANISETIKKAD